MREATPPSSPLALKEATATSTPAVCDRQAPEIPSVGGDETKMTVEEIAKLVRARAIREKQEQEKQTGKKLLTCEDVDFAENFAKEHPVLAVVPTAEPPTKAKPADTPTAEPPKPSPTKVLKPTPPRSKKTPIEFLIRSFMKPLKFLNGLLPMVEPITYLSAGLMCLLGNPFLRRLME